MSLLKKNKSAIKNRFGVGGTIFSERELKWATAYSERERSLYAVAHPSSPVCRLSVTLVHPAQPIEIFDNFSTSFRTLAVL